jgi:hypothetical protein
MASLLRYVAAVAFLCAAACAQPLTIRVINAANGAPLPKQTVTVAFYYSGDHPPAGAGADSTFTTDAHGEVHISLPDPAPEHITVQITPDARKWECACVAVFPTQQLLQTGIVEAPADKHRRVPIPAKPGEVIFAVRKYPFWQRLFAPLYRD